MKKLFFLISSLKPGGAEKVASLLINHWSLKYEVHLLTFTDEKEDFFPTNKFVTRHVIQYPSSSKLISNLERIIQIRKEIQKSKPEIIISFIDQMNILAILSSLNTGVRVIISERTNPLIHHVPLVWKLLRRFFYPLADSIVLQTDSLKEWGESLMLSKEKVKIIPNPCSPATPIGSLPKKERGNYILGVGRLDKFKGFHHLISAFAQIHAKHPSVNLIIIGEGPERDHLSTLAAAKGVKEKVFLIGKKKNVSFYLKSARLFILSSLYEGFPNVLVEAISLGTPSLSFDCPFGPSTILKDRKEYLVSSGDEHELAMKISWLLSDQKASAIFRDLSKNINKELNLEKISNKWENLFI